MTAYNKDARIAALKALPRDQVEETARALGIRTKPGESTIGICRAIEAREFSDLRTAQKLPQIKDIF